MRLQELLEASYTGPKGVSFKDYDSTEVKKVIDQVQESPEYKELTTVLPMTSSDLELKHGTFTFRRSKEFDYLIDVHGNIRNIQPPFRGKLATPQPDPDLYTRYINCIKEVLKKLEKKDRIDARSLDIPNSGQTSFANIDMSLITDSINISLNSFTDLVGCPVKLKGSLNIRNNLVPLSLVGCPKKIGKSLLLSNNKLLHLEHLPEFIGDTLRLNDTYITGLPGLGRKYLKSCKYIDFAHCEHIKSNLLGLLVVKDLIDVYFSKKQIAGPSSGALAIIQNAILTDDRDIMDVQELLIQAGFKDFAKL